MNETDPPQLGGRQGGGRFEVGGDMSRQGQRTVAGASAVESVLWEHTQPAK